MKPSLLLTGLFTCASLFSPPVQAFSNAPVGSPIDDAELLGLDGKTYPLFSSNALVNVFVFFRPGQTNSHSVLKQMARLQQEMADQPIHWVGIVSDHASTNDAAAEVAASGIRLPVLIDSADTLYGRLGVTLEPSIGIADPSRRLLAYQPYARINFFEVLRARIRRSLDQITDAELAAVLSPPTPPGPDSRDKANRRLALARRLYQNQHYSQARDQVQAILEQEPGLAEGHALLGWILAAEGKCVEALPRFEQALKLDPANTNALAGLQHCRAKEKQP
jgi:tetratricopeptide (TPR) repeat protein